MEYRALGTTGLKVSSIGMGCVTFGREIDERVSFEVLDHAWEKGINLYDTAASYAQGASETVLGKWIADRGLREQVVLATKVFGTMTKNHVIQSAEESLTRLGTDRIDLFQLHYWDDQTPLEETLAGLTTLVDQGKVRFVGCSNWQAWQLAKGLLLAKSQSWVCMQSVQPSYNLVQREIESDLLPLCCDQEMGVITYSPLAAGFLSGKYRRDLEVPKGTRFDVIPGHQPIYFTNEGFAVLERLELVAKKAGRSMVELALSWALSRQGVTSVLIGARNTDQVAQAFRAESFKLDKALAAELTP